MESTGEAPSVAIFHPPRPPFRVVKRITYDDLHEVPGVVLHIKTPLPLGRYSHPAGRDGRDGRDLALPERDAACTTVQSSPA